MSAKTIIFLAVIGSILLGVIGGYFIAKKTIPLIPSRTTTVSGTIDLNGTAPSGATISIGIRPMNSTQNFTPFATNLLAEDHIGWSTTNVTSGKSYELQATVLNNGKIVATSDPVAITAPASAVSLRMNIVTQTPSAQNAVISGQVIVNGYIPGNSTVKVQGRVLGKGNFTTVATIPAQETSFLTYSTAVAGQAYEVKGTLFDNNGNSIGQSNTIVVSAPAQDEQLTINSDAASPQAPNPTAAPAGNTPISGVIRFNGNAQPDTRVVVLAKQNGQSNFQVAVDNIPPVDGATWTFSTAQQSQWYQMLAVLKQHNADGTDTDLASSSTITIADPATNQSFVINSGFTFSAPTGSITSSCGNRNGNTWSASVSVQSVPNAQSYWIQVGSSNGASDVASNIFNGTNNPNQTISVSLNEGTTYYARYAYATSSNAQQSQFSPFSNVNQFQCN